ncbi:alanine racemase [Blautia sp. HCP28S3_G10]|uniref:alanine racemase n=1 Tax=Blautia sp. HCP28S3_G10 TaxID=3438908 RepID=UPI003F8B2FF3
MKKFDRVRAVVSLDAIAHNFEEMKKNITDGTKIVAVIKADGYGHGAEAIARLVENYDYIWGFATATAEEALQLKRAGIKKPVLILGLVFEEYYRELIDHEVRMTVCEYETAQKLSEEAVRQGKNVHIHIGLDTGMSRIGFADSPESVEEIRKISELQNVEIEGMFTHFARADETDVTPAVDQLNRYLAFVELLDKAGIEIPLKHCSNSAGIIRMKEANLNMVRAGITIYGIYPSADVERDIVRLIPAMELKSHVTYVKDLEPGAAVSYGGTYVADKKLRVATIPVGYADGYPRTLSGKGWVLIHGKKAPILGRVCMDQFMVDVTEIPDVKNGDEVTLIGKDGDEFISIETFGDMSGRFSYEFACDISKRVPRVYIKDGKDWGDLTFFE